MWIQNVDSELYSIAFSPDSRTLYTSGVKNRIDAWDAVARTSRILIAADDPDAWGKFTVSTDGRYLILTPPGALVVRDAATGDVVSRTEWPTDFKHASTQFSHDKRHVLKFDWAPALLRWDWTPGAIPEVLPWRWSENSGYPATFALHPDGRTLAVGERGPAVVMFDATTGEELTRLTTPLPTEKILAFTPSGHHLVVFGEGGALTTFEWPSGQLLWAKKPGGQISCVRELAFHPTKPIVAYTTAKPPKAWPSVAWFGDVNTGEPLSMPHPGFKSAVAFAFSPDGLTCAVGGSNKQFAVFDVDV
jgi:WD40 repeat protein